MIASHKLCTIILLFYSRDLPPINTTTTCKGWDSGCCWTFSLQVPTCTTCTPDLLLGTVEKHSKTCGNTCTKMYHGILISQTSWYKCNWNEKSFPLDWFYCNFTLKSLTPNVTLETLSIFHSLGCSRNQVSIVAPSCHHVTKQRTKTAECIAC